MSQKFLDLAGLTAYDGKIKEWIKAGVIDITDDEIRILFVTPNEYPVDNEIWYTSTDGNVVTPYATDVFGANIVSNTYENGKGVITFDGEATSIGEWAFAGCSSLTSITIPNSVTTIGNYAFMNCQGLTSITIPNSVTGIGNNVFWHCSSLTSITIPNSVTTIGYSAFSNCSGLTSIIVEDANSTYDSRENCNAIIETTTNTLIAGCQNTIIPNSVTSIGNTAFYCCSSLTSVTIPDSITTIGYSAFAYCSGLTSITIPNSVTSIGNTAFAYCSGLTSITIPNSVTSIEGYAFSGCSSVTSITIPNSVTSIGEDAFYDCSDLNSITYEGTQEQWNAVSKGSDWNYNVPATYVQCTDGKVTL
jgi:hypothetical protein